jgi:nitroimidazol reductase NimA-like FMN-containing flavoprotein (pyridoxamine 5'-phosphate oxidase superfamily)
MSPDALLGARTPLRLAAQGKRGPLIVPLWFYWETGRFWCASHRDAALIRALRDVDAIAFDLSTNEMPYVGIRGRGRAVLHPDLGSDVLERLIDRYLSTREHGLARWLLSRAAEEIAIEVVPHRLTTWDYSARMKGLEGR